MLINNQHTQLDLIIDRSIKFVGVPYCVWYMCVMYICVYVFIHVLNIHAHIYACHTHVHAKYVCIYIYRTSCLFVYTCVNKYVCIRICLACISAFIIIGIYVCRIFVLEIINKYSYTIFSLCL